MKNVAAFVVLGLALLIPAVSHTQVNIWIDTTYGDHGKTEINIGGFNNEITGSYINRISPITLCAKISTPTSGIYHFGMVRVDTNGKLDPGFGTGGIVNISWNQNDYPTNMLLFGTSDTTFSYIFSGVSSSSALVNTWLPCLYRFKMNGIPDSSFGTNGRIQMPFADGSSGEADHVFQADTGYVICGTSRAISENSGKTGFGVMRIDTNGHIHPAFGSGGRTVIPALVHSVNGFFLNDRHIFMCGVSDTGKHELLIGRCTENGVPDSSVGVNGLIHTGIFIPGTGSSIRAAMRGDEKIMILLSSPDSSPTPITLCRFDPHGFLDSGYGINGLGRNKIAPSIEVKGMNPSSDGSTFICGMSNIGLGESIFTRLNDTTAAPDPKYFLNGIALIDVDNGENRNYMQHLVPIGKLGINSPYKRYTGIGGSIHNGVEYLMISRFITGPASSVRVNSILQGNPLAIYPNPATSVFTIEVAIDAVKDIRIVDALGREILRLSPQDYSQDTKTFSANAANLPNGVYYCIAQSGASQYVLKFVVAR